MHRRRKRFVVAAAISAALALALVVAAVVFVRAGIYNVGADDPHFAVTHAVLGHVRDASIQARARELDVPSDLSSPARIVQGAGNYDAMCVQCHLAPGMGPTELSKGLYPAPPDLTREVVDAAEAFWVIRHGIKGSGMPAWGGHMGDEYIWNMAAFIRTLPTLDAAGYRALVASSGGHSHGGGETAEHPAHPGVEGGTSAHGEAPPTAGHAHAPGTPAHNDGPVAPARAGRAGSPMPVQTEPPSDHVDPPGAPPHSH